MGNSLGGPGENSSETLHLFQGEVGMYGKAWGWGRPPKEEFLQHLRNRRKLVLKLAPLEYGEGVIKDGVTYVQLSLLIFFAVFHCFFVAYFEQALLHSCRFRESFRV